MAPGAPAAAGPTGPAADFTTGTASAEAGGGQRRAMEEGAWCVYIFRCLAAFPRFGVRQFLDETIAA